MEEAYAALYQEFLRIQSLCLKQAAMLQHLSETVQTLRASDDLSHMIRRVAVLDLSEQKHQETVLETRDAGVCEELKKIQQQMQQPLRRPWSSSFLDSAMVSEAGGLFMSAITVQSQVCEFCHAVFPGHTSTRGAYLRHLATHMS